jgi:hypothetical protein
VWSEPAHEGTRGLTVETIAGGGTGALALHRLVSIVERLVEHASSFFRQQLRPLEATLLGEELRSLTDEQAVLG